MKQYNLQLRKAALTRMGPARSAYHLSQISGITKPTAARYVHRPSEISAMDARAIGTLLVAAAGQDPESVLDLRLGDIFELIPIPDETADTN